MKTTTVTVNPRTGTNMPSKKSLKTIIKRDGQIVPWDVSKIASAIEKAFIASGQLPEQGLRVFLSSSFAKQVETRLCDEGREQVDIEEIQDMVEGVLMCNYPKTGKAFILYREKRREARGTKLMATLGKITFEDARNLDIKRENANIDCNTPMGTMLKYGSEGAKAFNTSEVLSKEAATAHAEGDIHIHDLDFLTLTTTCCEIDLAKLFTGGFSTGHGFLREPNSIQSAAALAAIAIQGNQNDQHGGQGIPFFERDLAPFVKKTLRKEFTDAISEKMETLFDTTLNGEVKEFLVKEDVSLATLGDSEFLRGIAGRIAGRITFEHVVKNRQNSLYERLYKLITKAAERAISKTDRATFQAMESFVHNLNSMHSRAGAQVPFSSINYGTDTSLEGRMIVKNLLLTTMDGLGKGETPIFPIQIFRVKKGINFEPGEPNYDLFELACKCSAKRMFPNFSFQDAPFNLQFYNPEDYNTEIAYMGCRTRVIANAYDKDYQKTAGRGNLSFTSINLPRLALKAVAQAGEDAQISKRRSIFRWLLNEQLTLVSEQLMERYKIIARKKVHNFPFLMGQGVWHESEKLDPDDCIGEVLKHGTLSIGFIGLAEALFAITGAHHAENPRSQLIGLDIVEQMRKFCDEKTAATGMNYTLIATPAEGLSGRFSRIDREKFGIIRGVTDKEFYTNSFHVPVEFEICAFDKISIEAPYHKFTNAGHITYVELDGDMAQNIEAFMDVVKQMGKSGIGYGAINHPLDRDPVCGYSGIIDAKCPGCGRWAEDDGIPFERIRRITGYLVGTLERFNDAKRAEEAQRVKHV